MGRTWTNKQRNDKSHKERYKKVRDSKKNKRHTVIENNNAPKNNSNDDYV
jgi:hypothetical protein